jgi:hypothetical protein
MHCGRSARNKNNQMVILKQGDPARDQDGFIGKEFVEGRLDNDNKGGFCR